MAEEKKDKRKPSDEEIAAKRAKKKGAGAAIETADTNEPQQPAPPARLIATYRDQIVRPSSRSSAWTTSMPFPGSKRS